MAVGRPLFLKSEREFILDVSKRSQELRGGGGGGSSGQSGFDSGQSEFTASLAGGREAPDVTLGALVSSQAQTENGKTSLLRVVGANEKIAESA